MATYKVQQMAEIWYQTEVEADSVEEAIDKAQESGDWEQLLDTTEFTDNFYTLNEDEEDGDWEEYK
jgi:hypothetical protein